jgi:hypothetical protein
VSLRRINEFLASFAKAWRAAGPVTVNRTGNVSLVVLYLCLLFLAPSFTLLATGILVLSFTGIF